MRVLAKYRSVGARFWIEFRLELKTSPLNQLSNAAFATMGCDDGRILGFFFFLGANLNRTQRALPKLRPVGARPTKCSDEGFY